MIHKRTPIYTLVKALLWRDSKKNILLFLCCFIAYRWAPDNVSQGYVQWK